MHLPLYATLAERHPLLRRLQSAVVRVREAWKRPEERRVGVALLAAGASALAFAHVAEDYLTNDPLARWDVSFAHWLSLHRSAAGVDVFRVVTDAGSPASTLAVATVVCLVLYRC